MTVGQRGHFQYISYSAFDPIFFLHHAMVDRVVGMWQEIYPDTWVEPVPSDEATFTTARGQMQDSSTPLTPFRKDENGGFWDSDMSRKVEAFGYSYQDMFLDERNSSIRRQQVIARINSLYAGAGPYAVLFGDPSKGTKPGAQAKDAKAVEDIIRRELDAARAEPPRDWDEEPNFSSRYLGQPPPASSLIRDGQYSEWLANIQVQDSLLGGPFSIHLFWGHVPEVTDDFLSAPNLVGTMSVFSMTSVPGMSHGNKKVSSTVPLTAALLRLMAARRLGSLADQEVVPLMQSKLSYMILDAEGQLADVTPGLGLSIGIASALVRAPETADELPRWGRLKTHFMLEGEMTDEDDLADGGIRKGGWTG